LLRNESLYANIKKCDFFMENFMFLGYVVSAKGIEMDDTKFNAIKEWHISKMVSEVRSFHWLTICKRF